MNRFVTREKMGKKARRQLDNQQRRTWQFCPLTKTVESKKRYDRKQKSRESRYDWDSGIFSVADIMKM